MVWSRRVCLLVPVALLVTLACGGSTGESPSPSASTPAQLTPSSSPAGTPVALDPCQIVTSSEASTLAGATFGAGKEEATGTGGKTCVYGSQTLNVFSILLAQASDATTAQATFAQAEAQAKTTLSQGVPSNVKLNVTLDDTTIAGADKAATATGTATISGQTISLSAVYVLKGTVFFTFSDLVLGHPAPTLTAMETQAQTSLSRIP